MLLVLGISQCFHVYDEFSGKSGIIFLFRFIEFFSLKSKEKCFANVKKINLKNIKVRIFQNLEDRKIHKIDVFNLIEIT